MENATKNSLAIPVSIVVAGALIATALYFVNNNQPQTGTVDSNGKITLPKPKSNAPERKDVAGVQANDHLRGNKDAKLVIVEFSDPECPFCNRYHSTMKQVVEAFPNDVAWVYRNFPLTSLHSKAIPEAIALECAAEVGGEGKFWEYTDMLYSNTPGNDGLAPEKLVEFATAVGLDTDAFAKCREGEEAVKRVQEDFEEAAASGGQGTPYSLVLYKGEQVELPGAIPFEDYQSNGQTNPGMKSIVESILAQ